MFGARKPGRACTLLPASPTDSSVSMEPAVPAHTLRLCVLPCCRGTGAPLPHAPAGAPPCSAAARPPGCAPSGSAAPHAAACPRCATADLGPPCPADAPTTAAVWPGCACVATQHACAGAGRAAGLSWECGIWRQRQPTEPPLCSVYTLGQGRGVLTLAACCSLTSRSIGSISRAAAAAAARGACARGCWQQQRQQQRRCGCRREAAAA